MRIESSRPHLLVRASTTKSRKDAVIPLHRRLADELRKVFRNTSQPGSAVFVLSSQISRTFKSDLLRAGIEPVDALGRKLDFHALRYTFATRLAQKGVSQRMAQELMRHSDPALTATICTDASQLPTFEAVTAGLGRRLLCCRKHTASLTKNRRNRA